MVGPEHKGGLPKDNWSPPSREAPGSGITEPPILVIGLGNPILGDDGVGWLVADQVRLALENNELALDTEPEVEVDSLSLGGLSLMERLVGYKHVIIIDALTTHQNPIGTLYKVPLTDLPDLSDGHTTAAHDTSLQTALNVGRSMGAQLPEHIMVVGIEAEMVYDFTDQLTPDVQSAISEAKEIVLNLLSEWLNQENKQLEA